MFNGVCAPNARIRVHLGSCRIPFAATGAAIRRNDTDFGEVADRAAQAADTIHVVSAILLAAVIFIAYSDGRAWTLVPDGRWSLHCLLTEQPDFNWDTPADQVGLPFYFSREPVDLPAGVAVVCSGPLQKGLLPADTTAWMLQ